MRTFQPISRPIYVLTTLLVAIGSLSSIACGADAVDVAAEMEADKRKRGSFTTNFYERSPESDLKKLAKKFRWQAPKVKLNDYEIKGVKFSLFVPKSYQEGESHGLLVYMGQHRGGGISGAYHKLLSEMRLISVGPNHLEKDHTVNCTIGFALDAVHNMQRRYAIDPQRVYIAGLTSGANYASQLAVSYPNMFRGGFYMFGGSYFRKLISKEDPKKIVGASFPAPSGSTARMLRSSRFVIMCAKNDPQRLLATAIYEQGYKRDKLGLSKLVELVQRPSAGPSVDEFKAALQFLDLPLIHSAKRLMTTAERYERSQKYEDAWEAYSTILSRAPGTDLAESVVPLIERLKKRRDENFAFTLGAMKDGGDGPGKLALNKHMRSWGKYAATDAAQMLAQLDSGKATASELLEQRNQPKPDKPAAKPKPKTDPVPKDGDPDKQPDPENPHGNPPGNPEPATTPDPPAKPAAPDLDSPLSFDANNSRERIAAMKYDDARVQMTRDLGLGMDELKSIVERFSGTVAATRSEQIIREYEVDPKKSLALKTARQEREATQILIVARKYLRADNKKKARGYLERVVEEFPDTEAAKEAKVLLGEEPTP